MSGSTFNRSGYVFPNAATELFFGQGSTKLSVDGGARLRTKSIAILNLDSGSASLRFSFDNTSYASLAAGLSFGLNITTDRLFLKSGPTDTSCPYQITAALQSGMFEG